MHSDAETGFLKRLLQPGERRGRRRGTGAPPRRRKDLKHYLERTALVPDLRSRTRLGVIDELLQRLVDRGLLKDIAAAREAVLAREQDNATGIQNGIAIPHGICDVVDGLVCAIGLARQGIDFESIDGQPSRIFILTLAPDGPNAPHMELMALLAGVLDDAGRAALLDCTTEDEMRHVLSGGVPVDVSRATVVPATRGRPVLHLRDVLDPELMTPELLADSRDAAIDELLGFAVKAGLLADASAARAAVLAREAQMPTVLEDGMAMPHARLPGVERLLCMVGIRRAGLDFGGIPVQIVVLTLVPQDRPAPYIQFIAAISRALDAVGRSRLLEARTAAGVWSALTGVEVVA